MESDDLPSTINGCNYCNGFEPNLLFLDQALRILWVPSLLIELVRREDGFVCRQSILSFVAYLNEALKSLHPRRVLPSKLAVVEIYGDLEKPLGDLVLLVELAQRIDCQLLLRKSSIELLYTARQVPVELKLQALCTHEILQHVFREATLRLLLCCEHILEASSLVRAVIAQELVPRDV